MLDDHSKTDAEPTENGRPRERWVVYLSKDKRVLWTEVDNPDSRSPESVLHAKSRAPDAECPADLTAWSPLTDVALATHMPQYGTRRLTVDGEERIYTLKVFPDISLNGELKGIIQVVERSDTGDWNTDIKQAINALLDLTLSGVLLYSPKDDRILNVNRRVAQQTGYAMPDFGNMPGRRIFGDGGVAILRKIFQRMLKTGEGMIWGQELIIYDNYGQSGRYLCSLRAIPERPGPDSPLAMIISLDVAASDLQSDAFPSGPNHMFIMQAMRDGMWEFDFATRKLHYSRAFADIFGPEGLEGRPGRQLDDWLVAVHPADGENLLSGWRRLLKKGNRPNTQYRYRDPSGNWHWILSAIHAILNDVHGRPLKVIGTHLDITESVRTERNILDAEERLRIIFDNAGIGIAVAGLDGKLARVNPALAIMLGHDQDDLEGSRLSDFAPADDRGEIRSVLTRLVRSGRHEAVLEQRFLRADGEQIWVNLTATLSRKDIDGERYVILMVENVTERHARQEKLLYNATHDILTGGWNRGVLLERLEQHLSLALRHKQPLAFCMCDLDHFKSVNDVYGHQTGDMVLVEFVKFLTEAVRDTDLIGRYGGEEFGIVFPNTTAEGARKSMERARTSLRDKQFTDATGTGFRVTATFGIAGIECCDSSKAIIAAADEALYHGKEDGRDRVVMWSRDLCEKNRADAAREHGGTP